MSRYIDTDALKKDVARLHVLNDETEIRRAYECNPHSTISDFEETLVSVFDAIDDAPSIDIVFCKECKHWERLNYEAPKEGWCDDEMPYSDGRWVDADDFCSYGEREGE